MYHLKLISENRIFPLKSLRLTFVHDVDDHNNMIMFIIQQYRHFTHENVLQMTNDMVVVVAD